MTSYLARLMQAQIRIGLIKHYINERGFTKKTSSIYEHYEITDN